MKRNIFLGILIFSLAKIVYAQTEFSNEAEFRKAVPQKITGVQIVPPSQMDMPEPLIKEMAIENKERKTKGYIESNSPNPKNLMSIKERAPAFRLVNEPDPYNYYLRKDISEIKLSFVYKSISDPSKLIGFAPVGTTIKEGWTGIREFFDDSDLGVCSLTTYHLENSKMGIKINADEVSYIVNNNPTTMEAEGSNKTGYIYTVSWVNNTFAKDFECANMKFDRNALNKMVVLANKVDKL